MTTLRRRALRPPSAPAAHDARRQQQRKRRLAQLNKERASLQRWMGKLKRAFHAVEKQQLRIARLERAIQQLGIP